ncbi:sigma-70 family RNA polymerase sigma factor [Selenomonas flueggei]|uniref:sigma-70 family RNA polymerase sigma factor n=1 Tax=Selenomonas flueggei TaxID=135080 RepID=UPI002672E502|nr:sigma-70 family RNA polymerase sigma factor [Selenomonas flueggei]
MKSKGKRRDVPLLTKAEEDAVIARAVRGEAAAMVEMTARYRGLITAESHASYLRGSALAAEAENVAVLAFIEALHDYDAAYGPPFAGFVKARVHHALIAEFRRELRRRARTCAPQEDAAGHETWAACGTVCPTERADERLLAEDILTRAMHRLTEREKEVLDLHYFRDLTLRRIAVLLGTSAGALSKSKANLLRKLRACAALPLATAHKI